MKNIYTRAQVREHDRKLIQDVGMPSHSLMEVAGRGCAKYIDDSFPRSSIVIFCGAGNNGGDGYVIARWLNLWGWTVTVVNIDKPKTTDALINQRLLPDTVISSEEPAHGDIYIDALLGTGQTRALTGPYKGCVQWLNLQPQPIISIDIPTGRCPDRGSPLGETFLSPDICLSLGALKKGLYGQAFGMQIHEIDIGLQLSEFPVAEAVLLEESDIIERFPLHPPNIAKWDKGHVAIYARGGAAVLAAHAALISGAGLVTLLCPESEWSDLWGLRPEVMLIDPSELNPKRHNILIVGPNSGFSSESTKFILHCWTEYPNPMLLDADAIRIIADTPFQPSSFVRILTPHIAEAAHLLRQKRDHLKLHPYETVQALQTFGTSLLKGPFTKISSNPTYVNPTSCNRLSIAGSGDILSGLIGGLLAQRIPPIDSLIISCFIHGRSGENLQFGDSASDLLEQLKKDFQKIETLKVL